MSSKKTQNKKKKLIFCFVLFSFVLGLIVLYSIFPKPYDNCGLPTNENYSGLGQKIVSGQDGYFTTFTTNSANPKIYREYKQNGTSSWANHPYWGGTMSENGCGITSLSIILSGYGYNATPEKLRKQYYPVLDYSKLSSELVQTYHIPNSDFVFDSHSLSSNSIIEWLKTDRPVLVCVWNKPHANRWTSRSHYMVLLATDGINQVYVSNPNGGRQDSKCSGWYEIEEITPYLAKALFIQKEN